MTPAARRFFSSGMLLALVLLASGCSTLSTVFTNDAQTPLKGERLPVLTTQAALAADPALKDQTFPLPEAWANAVWPQAGGYPHHAMGHLALPSALKRVWQIQIGAGGFRRNPLIVQPIVADGMIFALDTRSRVAAFSTATGKRLWRETYTPRDEGDVSMIGGGLAYSAGRLFVTNGYNQVLCVNPRDGKVAWTSEVPSVVRSAPTVAGGRVYVITIDSRLFVFSAEDGKPLWNYVGPTETTGLLGSISPAVDSALAVLPLPSGDVVALRPENGQVAWSDNLSTFGRPGALASIADIRGHPVIDQGVVYVASFSGRTVALDVVSGQRLWQREIGSADTLWSAGDTVFVLTTDQQLTALTRDKGAVRWMTQLPRFTDGARGDAVVWKGPVLAGGRLILAGSDHHMIEIDPQTGRVLRRTHLPQAVMVPPLVADGTLFLLTEYGQLLAYR